MTKELKYLDHVSADRDVFTEAAAAIVTTEAINGHAPDDDEITELLSEFGGDYEITEQHIERVREEVNKIKAARK